MKAFRDGCKVVIEIEENDCTVGHSLEMTADLWARGINMALSNSKMRSCAKAMVNQIPFDDEEILREIKDFKDTWEL